MIKENFNRNWQFRKSTGSVFENLLGDPAQSIEVDLPHDASIHEKRSAEDPSGSGNGFFHENSCVYEKTWTPDETDRDKIFTLEFEGVYQNAFLYVNHAFVTKHPYGYGNFYADITKYLEFGQPNQVQVVVKNAGPSGRWYTGGGIYRDVHIMKADRLHLSCAGIHLAVTDLEKEQAVIRAEAKVQNQRLGVQKAEWRVQLYDAEQQLVSEASMPFTMMENEADSYRQNLYVANPHAWSAEDPYLYSYRAILTVDGTVCDEEEGIFGIRKLQLDPRHGLRVNGEEVKLRGGCLHHDNGVIGTAEFAHAEEVRVRNLKEAGFNAIRSSHYPMSRHLLEACDRLGMYVMDEFSDVWTSTKVELDYGMAMSEWWSYDITNMVDKDYNHPCVILYSIGNEIPETGNPFDVQWGKKLADLLRKLDDTRYIVNSMNLMLSVMQDMPKIIAELTGTQQSDVHAGGEINEMMTDLGNLMGKAVTTSFVDKATAEASGQVDITGLNYAAQRYELDRELHPDRIIVGSETYPMDLDINWALVEKYPNIIGDFDWTAYDYLGEAGIGKISYGDGEKRSEGSFYATYPCKAAYCGDINLLGDSRPVAFWRKSIWGMQKTPYIAVCPPAHYGEKLQKTQWAMTDALRSWNWKGYEGKPVRVEVYSDAEEVELLINGESVGRKQPGSDADAENKKNMAVFHTVYQPGQIEAVAYCDGKEVSRDLLKTAEDIVFIKAAADTETIPADGSDICYVELELVDVNGTRNPEAVRKIKVSAEGAGYVLGFGSADPESEENYFDSEANTYEGRLRAAIRADKAGEILVHFSSEGMDSVTVRILAE